VAGTTYDFEDEDVEPRASGHADILARVAQLLEKNIAAPDTAKLSGAVGFRCVAPDRMPLIGALPDLEAARAQAEELSGAHLPDLPRRPGLYSVSALASRGLIWAGLGGELVASQIAGEPLPVERDLADALDPARFALRHARRNCL
jgi:tRNA 5-methylaminomethyl-2-thiouridine biosynthesis bifunctional protein